MKKNIITVCVLLMVTMFMFVSCSGSLTDTLLKVMDSTSTNVFEQTGLVKQDTSATDNMIQALDTKPTEITIKTEGGENKVDLSANAQFADAMKALEDAGVSAEIKIDPELVEVASKALAPQTAEQKKAFAESISDIYSKNSNNVFAAAGEKFNKEVTDTETVNAVKGSMAIAAGLLDNISTEVGEDSDLGKILVQISDDFKTTAKSEGPITEGDKATAQLVTNVAVSAAAASSVLTDSSKTTAEKMESSAVKEFLNDANVLYNTSKLAAGSIDITKSGIFSLLLNNTESNSKNIDVDGIPENYKKLIPALVKSLLGTNPDQYKIKVRSLKAMINARNAAFSIVPDNLDEKTAGDYMILKNQASLPSIIEYITAAFIVQLDTKLSDDNDMTFLDLVIDVVRESGEGFFNNLETVNASEDNIGMVQKLFGDSDAAIKSVLKNVLENVKNDAKIADKMLVVGESSISALLEAMKIQTPEGEEITTISGFLDKFIGKME